jgi:TRAP-type mannitol/chloroaromatic compound transport system permease small subunit
MSKILNVIDSISIRLAEILKYFCFILVLVVTFDVIMRYVFNAPPQWAYESAIMLGGTIYIISWAYTHYKKAHVRVDVFYIHLSPRGRAIVDIVGTIFLTFPLITILIATSYAWAFDAWVIGERMKETYWYPPVGPFRTIVFLGYCFFLLQVVAQFIRDLRFVAKKEQND